MTRAIPVLLSLALLLPALGVSAQEQQPTELPPGGTFFDDDGSVHEGAIEALVAAGVVKGCSSEPAFYCPRRTVTRGEMALFLQRAFQLPPPPEPTDTFVDDDTSPYTAAIEAIAAAGITRGCDPDGTRFCPDGFVSREEMASFIARAIGAEGDYDPPPDAFDDDTGSLHETAINRLALLDVTNGCGERLYCPLAGVSRAEMASFLVRALGLTPTPPPPRPAPELVSSFTTYHDCCQPRVHNIQLMADTLDGVVVYPGQVFSVNTYVGARTAAKGYVEAPILLDGDLYCCALGGGVSQFATTMYNAIFWGGYEVVEHKPHSRYISRYPLGIEATLGYPSIDLAFRNDTTTPVEIRTSYTATSITVELWGDNMGRSVAAEVTGSATYTGGGSVRVVRTITEADGSTRSQTWYWTYLGG